MASGDRPGTRARRACALLLALVCACGQESESEPEAVPEVSLPGPPAVLPGHVSERFTGDLPEMRERKAVRALVSWSRTDFFLDGGRPRGIQAELLARLETFLNRGAGRGQPRVRVTFVPVRFEELLPALEEGRGDLAAAFLTPTPERESRVAFASARGLGAREIVVSHADARTVSRLEDLSGRDVHVIRGSSYEEHLKGLDARLRARGLAPVRIHAADPQLVSEDLVEMVNAGVAELTVVDDFRARLWAQVLPAIVLHEDVVLHEADFVGWAVRRDNPKLEATLEEYLRSVRKGSLIGNVLFQRYFGDTRWIRNPNGEAEREKLARYADLFRRYGSSYGFDWRAIAAQAYQESALDHARRSRAGAIGLMQILPRTASDPNVGIPDIHDVERNVHAGVKYLAFLRDRYFSDETMSEEDRLAFSWAAYNMGPGRMHKVRARADRMGLDSGRWFGHTEHAALAVVGREPVRYVANVFKYYVAYRLASDLRGEIWLAR